MTPAQQSAGLVERPDDGVIADLIMHLDGIVHFADGFHFYHSEGPAGQALREWINGARTVLAKATTPTADEGGENV